MPRMREAVDEVALAADRFRMAFGSRAGGAQLATTNQPPTTNQHEPTTNQPQPRTTNHHLGVASSYQGRSDAETVAPALL